MRYLLIMLLLLTACQPDKEYAKMKGEAICEDFGGTCQNVCQGTDILDYKQGETLVPKTITANLYEKTQGKYAGKRIVIYCPQNKDCCIPFEKVISNIDNIKFYHWTNQKEKPSEGH